MATTEKGATRWLIAAMATVLMLCLGTVYAWSFFQGLLVREFKETFGWSNSQVAWIFSLAIFFLGVTAAWGGTQLPRRNPRIMAMIGALLFAAGYAVAAFAFSIRSLPLLYAGYGVIGGIGLGLGYVTPVATVSKWFPDRKGLATGMVVMGFGLGALFMSKVLAPLFLGLTGRNLTGSFLALSAVFLVLGLASAAFMRNPRRDGRRKDAWLPRKGRAPTDRTFPSAVPSSPAGSPFSGSSSSATSPPGSPSSASSRRSSRTCGSG